MALDSTVCTSYPSIYHIKLESTSINELVTTFYDEILQGCSFSNSELALVDYVTSVVDPVGWKAIWRSMKQSSPLEAEYDFIVEAVNVSLEKLEADIIIKSIICLDFEPKDLECWLKGIGGTLNVPLTELYLLCDEDEDGIYAKTAIAIEHVRIFQTQIIRPWDEEDDLQYTEEVLKSRLQLCLDIHNKALPRNVILKVQVILKEAKRIQARLQSLYSEMHAGDSDAEIGEEELLRSVSLKKRLYKLRAKMEMLENPLLRSFVTEKYIPNKVFQKQPKSKPVTYVVSKELTWSMIKSLPMDYNTVLELEHSPETAFKSCSSGDTIFLFPGVYQCDTLGWIEGNVSIQGVGRCEDIALEATGNSEVLLNCCGGRVELLDLTLRATVDLLAPLVVHHGHLSMNRCYIDATDAEVGLLLLGGAEAVLQHTTVCHAKEDGITLRPLSSLSLKSSCVRACGRNAVHIDGECSCSPDSFTEMQLQQSRLQDNASHAIFVSNVPITDISLQRPTDQDFSVLTLFPWLKCKMEESTFENNGATGIGVSSYYKKDQTKSPISATQDGTLEELNYSALSDLLNEVNLSHDSTYM